MKPCLSRKKGLFLRRRSTGTSSTPSGRFLTKRGSFPIFDKGADIDNRPTLDIDEKARSIKTRKAL
jgi:hypothetical protein